MDGDKPKKAHKKRTSGQKAKKKKESKTGKVEKHNPKAHTFSGGKNSVRKRVQFTLERQSRKEHAPKSDKNPEVPPPFIVVIQGPPGVGKTTLIHSLVKHFARQRLLEMRGPVTLVSGRQRRLTIVECPQEMSAMLDLAKIADLVLLLIDASFGFELETFEFINILQVHGFPRVIGVLTHLDRFKDNKQLRKVKKTMKQRFWTELYDGAKLFHLSGLQYGRYHVREVQNLARFISVQKVPILSWRQSHPYLLALRWEDHTEPTAPVEAPRVLDLYGYVYGGRLRQSSQVHFPGVGDFTISAVKQLPDPCPPPMDVEADRQKAKKETGKPGEKTKRKNALRTLAERHRIVYAPGSDIGSITVDSEAMYINLPEQEVSFTKKEGEDAEKEPKELPEAVKLVRELQNRENALDRVAAQRQGLRLLRGSSLRVLPDFSEPAAPSSSSRSRRLAPTADASVPTTTGQDGSEADGEGEEEEDDNDAEDQEELAKKAVLRRGGGGGEDVDEADEDELHKRAVHARARERFSHGPRLEELIYGPVGSLGGGAVSSSTPRESKAGGKPSPTDHKTVPLFDDDEDDMGPPGGASGSKDPLLGNLGDLDAIDSSRMARLPGALGTWDDERKEALKERKFITGGWSSAEEDEVEKEVAGEGEESGAKAEKAAAGEDGADKAAAGKLLDGFSDSLPIASFVRIRLEDVPAACVAELRSDRPIILGGLLPGESRMGQVQVRVKRHRWHPKLLKSGDAMLLSVGWRRFQTVPTFSLEDRGEKRMRFLKYTLEHAHCTMTNYGPMVPPNTGVLAFRSWEKVGHFRVCATGVVLESAPNFEIVKKLKLVGEPYKIFRNTAFVKNMFNSDLEVSKYMHAKIQTVSGVRGEIKKAEGPKGNFRATFEDRILMSDLVICKCWVGVSPKQFYHPVIDVAQWRPARLIGELRANSGVPVPDNKDSHYGKQVVRAERKFNALKVPKALKVSLPFGNRIKFDDKKPASELRQKAAIVSSEREMEINQLLNRLSTVRQEKQRIRDQASAKKKAVKEARERFIQERRDVHTQEAKKKRYIKQGHEEARRRKAMRLD